MAAKGRGNEDVDVDVYATLLLSDTYLPGALVLAHSLRDAGTTKQLAVLVTLDTVSAEAISELKTVYHHVIPVSRIRNHQPDNLHLMNRADLHSAFTKINLWKQMQFRKIVYIDADVVAYRAPDELFDIAHHFSAAPDTGWPDLFNTGVMALTPNMGDYYAMMAMAERNISFDGADQGLINMHFQNNYNRISFTYNVTPSAHYQYLPAYRHFQSTINMVHFIGSDKPWFNGRHASNGSSPFDQMTGRWWAVYDRHYREPSPRLAPSIPQETSSSTFNAQSPSELVQYLTKGEYQPKPAHLGLTSKPLNDDRRDHEQTSQHPQHAPSDYRGAPHPEAQGHHDRDQAHGHEGLQSGGTVRQAESSSSGFSESISSASNVEGSQAEAREGQIEAPAAPWAPSEPEQKPEPFQPSMASWDAQRHAPPTHSKPEAENFPIAIYQMSQDSAPFVAPQRYPSPPRNMWYEVSKDPPAPPKPIFPWETQQAKASRVFADEPKGASGAYGTPTGEHRPSPVLQPSTESSIVESSTVQQKDEPVTPITPTIHITPSDPWTTYTRTNAWDEVPAIERYVDSMQKHRRSQSLKSPGVIAMPSPGEGVDEIAWRRQGKKLTDFPSEVERPSLPVTPAPIRRAKFWGGVGPGIGDGDDDPHLPAAEGVPAQSEWDSAAQLRKLAEQHSDAVLQKLGSGSGRDSSDYPPRALPFGSEELVSPTYVAHTANVLSPQPVKGRASSSAVRMIDPETTSPGPSQPRELLPKITTIPGPSYSGPGPAFEKGENSSSSRDSTATGK
ncbi:Uu.00g091370.m01.CDS01 [Anthostomella pinea]|uniref:glycogenin glucosyltransferase n=1 Tax=Anthostomella pinea TaxID=933095 RepID=A0AAI8YK89_9PEZI|nr:Uu.00g091370.m01.CDS01 [Anthostomella pinea]